MPWIAPVPRDARGRRLAQLYAGLVLYGVANALMVLSALGLDPWDVLHQGLSRTIGLGIGTWTCIVGAVVLVGWIPLHQRPGLGTASNVVVIGLVVNIILGTVTPPHALPARCICLLGGVLLNGVATGAYIGAGLGPGPRDGLTTGLVAARGGRTIRRVRTLVEIAVLASGWLLGGTLGIGTVTYALLIGPLTHLTIPRLDLSARRSRRPVDPLIETADVGC
ncbi:MAG: hypothetical protein WBQ18_00575 [Solirubrobacteraceae bacterium]